MDKKFKNLSKKILSFLLKGVFFIAIFYIAVSIVYLIDTRQEDKNVSKQAMPTLEEFFINIVNKAIDDYQTTDNKVSKNKIVFDLSKSLSDLFKDTAATDWVGYVISIDTDQSDTSATIKVALSIKNFPQSLIFLTAIDINIGTDLYDAVSELKPEDKVVFSGRFISLPKANVEGFSIFDNSEENIYFTINELDGTTFGAGLFKFTSIRKIISLKNNQRGRIDRLLDLLTMKTEIAIDKFIIKIDRAIDDFENSLEKK